MGYLLHFETPHGVPPHVSESLETGTKPGTSRHTPPAMSGQNSSVKSMIGPTLVIKGSVTAEEDLLVRGRIEGSIEHNQTLTVHAEGSVQAVVKAKEVLIEGSVEGEVFGTERVKVCETGQMVGNVCAPRVGVSEGATFKGMVDMDSDTAAIEKRFSELSKSGAKSNVSAATGTPGLTEASSGVSSHSESQGPGHDKSMKTKGRRGNHKNGKDASAHGGSLPEDAAGEASGDADAPKEDSAS